jgi:hypothetical protein
MMTNPVPTNPSAAAHVHGRSAARCLQVAGYCPDHGYWCVGTMHPAWHALVDPEAAPGEWLWAARVLLGTLAHDVTAERREASRGAGAASRTGWDPHDAVWHTTLSGAVLEIARDHLLELDRILVDLGVEPERPASERYRLISSLGRPNGPLSTAI